MFITLLLLRKGTCIACEKLIDFDISPEEDENFYKQVEANMTSPPETAPAEAVAAE